MYAVQESVVPRFTQTNAWPFFNGFPCALSSLANGCSNRVDWAVAQSQRGFVFCHARETYFSVYPDRSVSGQSAASSLVLRLTQQVLGRRLVLCCQSKEATLAALEICVSASAMRGASTQPPTQPDVANVGSFYECQQTARQRPQIHSGCKPFG